MRIPINLNVRDIDQKAYWERHAHGRKWGHPVVSFFVQQRLAWLGRFINWSTIQSILDVGCGYGNTLHFLQGKIPFRVGVDGSFTMLSRCPRKAAFFIQSHVARLPFRDESFDCLIAWEVLHHLEDPVTAVKEFVRVSRRYVILFEPNRHNPIQFLFGLLDRSERGTLHFSKKRLEELSQDSELTVLHSATVGITFPNRMPTFLLPVVKRIPFHLPFVGISSFVVGLRSQGHVVPRS